MWQVSAVQGGGYTAWPARMYIHRGNRLDTVQKQHIGVGQEGTYSDFGVRCWERLCAWGTPRGRGTVRFPDQDLPAGEARSRDKRGELDTTTSHINFIVTQGAIAL